MTDFMNTVFALALGAVVLWVGFLVLVMLALACLDARSFWREWRRARELRRAQDLIVRRWVRDRWGEQTGRRTSLRWWDRGR